MPRNRKPADASEMTPEQAEAAAQEKASAKHDKFRTMAVDHIITVTAKDGTESEQERKGRLTRVRESIASLGKLTNKSAYAWTEEDALAILTVIEQDVSDLRDKLIPPKGKGKSKLSVTASLFNPHRTQASEDAAAEFGIGPDGHSNGQGQEQEEQEQRTEEFAS